MLQSLLPTQFCLLTRYQPRLEELSLILPYTTGRTSQRRIRQLFLKLAMQEVWKFSNFVNIMLQPTKFRRDREKRHSYVLQGSFTDNLVLVSSSLF